ncbi:glycosyltransferase family 2 protein [Leeuwenhoekiella sp. W20_SRS_FM14]|uniref:glycosyltransferase family 2 protein n=1 Tax=Leeuwenhoekiella sp. W20_SRS_FM14 TaxID=3240270 RepID=UPI003F968AFF
MTKKVSVIIPVFNRENLVLETLESIANQDYPNWECILVDDHSTDNSVEVVSIFIENDTRFKLYLRPKKLPKGANSCRNYGFELSTGYYIQWFDSDDLMLPTHISSLIEAIQTTKSDFAVGDSQNFIEGEGLTNKPYMTPRLPGQINANTFGRQGIGWITNDFLCKREMLFQVKFNENFKTDGDEYNFFTRFLHLNTNGIWVNKILTHRRVHKNSLSSEPINSIRYLKKVAFIKFIMAKDIEEFNNKALIKWFLSGYMQYSFKLALKENYPPFFKNCFSIIADYFGKKQGVFFVASIFSALLFKRGYFLLRRAIQF